MGIKENLTQAFRELTGGVKDADKKNMPVEDLVDELEKAVEAYGAPRQQEAPPPGGGTPDDMTFREAFFAKEKRQTPPATFAEALKQVEETTNFNAEPAAQISASASADAEADISGAADTDIGDDGFADNFTTADFSGFRQRSDTEDTNELTVITGNTIIDGKIRSFANLSIDGHVKGDVETTKNIDMNGKIIGNITCNNALMGRSQIQGNIRIKGSISMNRDTLLIGDITSTHAEVNGKIKGNVDVAGKAELKRDAVIFGDINASTITVEDGAIIRGHVSTTALNSEESRKLFPEAIVID